MKNLITKNTVLLSFISVFVLALIGLTSGCDLTPINYSNASINSFYKNKKESQLALNGVYQVFWNIYKNSKWEDLTDVTGGLLTHPNPGQYDNFAWTNDDEHAFQLWQPFYVAINRANTLLDNLENSDISDNAKADISGQAKFLRALSYFDLVKLFGGVPLYFHGTRGLKNAFKPQASVDEVYKQIESDLQDAIQALSPYSESDHEAGKATSGAARALLAMVYAQQQEWSKAASTAKKVIESNHFELMDDYNDVFNASPSMNKEQIFSIQHGNGVGAGSNSANHNVKQFSPATTTLSDGTNVSFYKSPQSAVWYVNKSFFNKAPNTYRKSQTMRNKMPYYYVTGTTNIVNKTVSLNHPYVVKFNVLDEGTGRLKSGVNTPIIRYSNILLIYAEALNEVNGGPTPAAYNAINKVRARARGTKTSQPQPQSAYPPLSGLSQDQFRDAVLTEMAREFIGEGKRRAELLRHGLFIKKAQERGINAQDYQKLYPIPHEAIETNKNLTQNPGYK